MSFTDPMPAYMAFLPDSLNYVKATCSLDTASKLLNCCLGTACGFYSTDFEFESDDFRQYAVYLGRDPDRIFDVPITLTYDVLTCPNGC